MRFREYKRHVNKPDEVYDCDLVGKGRDWALLRYVSTRSWTVAGTHLPAGSTTLAFYRTGADWVLWRMAAPKGDPVGHLFHVCCDLQVGRQDVSYRDLLLDVWVDGAGRVVLLDEEEVAACVKAGALTDAQAATIAHTGARIGREWREQVEKLKGCYASSLGGASQKSDCR